VIALRRRHQQRQLQCEILPTSISRGGAIMKDDLKDKLMIYIHTYVHSIFLEFGWNADEENDSNDDDHNNGSGNDVIYLN